MGAFRFHQMRVKRLCLVRWPAANLLLRAACDPLF
jgi:hypothetical protein